MSRKVGLLMGIGAVVAVVAGALVLVLSDPPLPEDGASDAADVTQRQVPSAEPEVNDSGSGRRRTRVTGGSALFGIVQHAADEMPAVAQSVRLVGDSVGTLEITTDSSGAFRFESLPPGGPYALEIDAEGFAPIRLPGIALARSEERDLGTLLLDLAVRVEVHVRDMTGDPLEGAQVSAYASPEFGWGFDWSKAMAQMGQDPVAVATATSDADGTVVFDELASGSWTFMARKVGYASTGKPSIRLRSSEIPEPVSIYMPRGYTLSGRVLDENDAPVAGALVLGGGSNNVWNVGAAPLRVRAVSGQDGSYALAALPAGDTSILAAPAGATPAQVVTLRIPDVSEFDIRLRAGGVLAGVVTLKENGEPVEGAKVRAMSWGTSGSRTGEAVTDAAGHYTIEGLPEGNVGNITVEKSGMVQVVETTNVWQPTPFRRGERVEMNLQLIPGAVVTGQVTGPGGAVAGARVMVMYERQRGNFDQKQASTDSEGRYRVDTITAGRYLVQAGAPGLYTPDFPANWYMAMQNGKLPAGLSGEAVAGEESVANIVLKAGTTISGRVETADGEPVPGASVRAVSNGNQVGGTAEPAVTGEDGSFRVEGVIPSPQVVIAAAKKGLAAAPRDAIAVSESTPVEGEIVVMQALPVVHGRITSATGDLPEDTYVLLAAIPNMGGGRFRFDPSTFATNAERHPVRRDGTYEVTIPWTEGGFTVQADAPGFAPGTSERTALEDGRSEYEVDVQIGDGLSLSGRVVSELTGEGIAGAHVRVTSSGPGGATLPMATMLNGSMVSYSAGGGGGGGAVVAITDEAGAFTASGLGPGDQNVSATAEGFVGGNVDARTPFSGLLNLPLSPELELSGRVTFGDGSGVGGVTVNAVNTESGGGSNGVMNPMGGGGAATATTDAAGGFVLRGLPRGQYVLSVQNGWGGTANVQPFRSQPTAAGSSDVNLTVQKGLRIAGRIVDETGELVAQCWIWANAVGKEGAQPVNAQAKPDGTFELVGLTSDVESYNLTFNAQQMGGGFAPVTLEKVKPGTTGLEVVMQSGLKIEGKILDASGKALTNAWIRAQPIRQDGESGPTTRGNGIVEADGSFTIGGLEAGRYSLALQTWGGNGGARQMILEGGQDVAAGSSGLRLTATLGATISGTVVDGAGRGVPHVSVQASPVGGGNGGNTQTDENGAFEIAALQDGVAYNVTVRARGKIGSQAEKIAAGTSGLRLEARDGVDIEGRALAADGSPLKQAWIFLRPVDKTGLTPQTARTDENGRFTATGLENGAEYKAQVRVRDGGASRTIELGTVTGGQTGVELRAAD